MKLEFSRQIFEKNFKYIALGSCDRASLTQEKKEPTDDTSIDVYSQQLNSTCFGHHYTHRQENRLYKTVCGVSLDVLAAVVWSRDMS